MGIIASSPPRYISVQKIEQLSPHLRRIYFSSDDFSDLSVHQNGAHIKLFFPEQAHLIPLLPKRTAQGKIFWPQAKKPMTRTYTIRNFFEKAQLLVVDFVMHGDGGVAAHWANHAKIGNVIGLAGPGGPRRFNSNADYWIFIGDLSSLAMISASLEQLPEHAQGQIWIEIEDQADKICFAYPNAMQINWIIKDQNTETKILKALRCYDWTSKVISVSLAGEHSRVLTLRNFLLKDIQLSKSYLYAVPYWKETENEESYHEERHQFIDAVS